MSGFYVQMLPQVMNISSDLQESPGVWLVPDDSEYGFHEEEMTSDQFTTMSGGTQNEMNYTTTNTDAAISTEFAFLVAVTTSICLVLFLARFLEPRLRRGWGAVIYLLTGLLSFYVFQQRWLKLFPDAPVSPFLPVPDFIFLFALLSLFYKGRSSKKLYLALTFQALFELGIVLHDYGTLFFKRLPGMDFLSDKIPLYSYTVQQDYRPGPVLCFVQLDWTGCSMILLHIIILVLSVRKLTRRVPRDMESIPRRELLFLLMPAFTGIVIFSFTRVAGMMLNNPIFVEWTTFDNPFYSMILYLLIPFLAAVTILCILYAYDIYRKLIEYIEEKHRAEILANQMDQMQDHIREIEQLYTGIRSMRHDMKNYLFDIKSLLSVRGIDVEEAGSELSGYFSGIGAALDTLNLSIHTGNPVTDVVLNGKYQQAKNLGIRFESEFKFPSRYGIDAFDISIILNNALNNALEACEKLINQERQTPAFVTVSSYCKNNMFLIEIENSFDGVLLSRNGKAAPLTRKADTTQHGLGFQNIVRCAEKYLGNTKYTYSQEVFHLTVMLQRVSDSVVD